MEYNKKMKKLIRAFIAIELNPKLLDELKKIQKELQHLSGEISWTLPENLHISVRFLGNISPEQIKPIEQIIKNISKQTKSFDLSLGVLGVFPYINGHQVLWAGISSGYSQVTQISTLIARDLKSLNIKAGDKHFHPHITLARIKSLKNKSELNTLIDTIQPAKISEQINTIILFKSEINNENPVYTKIFETELSRP
ncbi:MAG: RNA 2',3'-cyclic phosphodiesterase [Candidatus Omnitrophica bacterium]|nr:RNA 2',3'-cyclic phosphodiesterase [Candidatus Omnitrophota bacterium]